MINSYVNKLIENLPEESKKKQKIDIVLDGGLFNGSYLVGALHFIKEMERKKYIEVDNISGCSIGSIIGLLYFSDSLDLMPKLYDIVNNYFKDTHNLNIIKSLKNILHENIDNNICTKINGKLFICYNDIKNNKKIVKKTYKNVDELFDTIIKSCYIPFLIDGNLVYKNKYVDGITPYIFKKRCDKKILYMELVTLDKLSNMINIKNERNNFHRILNGLLDVHNFFIKKSNTYMCSYVNDWNIIDRVKHKLKYFVEIAIIYIFIFFKYLDQNIFVEIKDNIFTKILSKIISDIFNIFLETYCL